MGFSLTIQLLGYPHDYGTPRIIQISNIFPIYFPYICHIFIYVPSLSQIFPIFLYMFHLFSHIYLHTSTSETIWKTTMKTGRSMIHGGSPRPASRWWRPGLGTCRGAETVASGDPGRFRVNHGWRIMGLIMDEWWFKHEETWVKYWWIMD